MGPLRQGTSKVLELFRKQSGLRGPAGSIPVPAASASAVQPGVDAALSRRRSWVQIPSEALAGEVLTAARSVANAKERVRHPPPAPRPGETRQPTPCRLYSSLAIARHTMEATGVGVPSTLLRCPVERPREFDPHRFRLADVSKALSLFGRQVGSDGLLGSIPRSAATHL